MNFIIPTDTCFGLACEVNNLKGFDEIYKIKGRDFNKPLAIMVDNFKYFEKYLNKKQINFLINYNRPWTLVIKNNDYLKKVFGEKVGNYEKIALRLANNETQKKLISKVGPIFLTSANLSGEKEIYKIQELQEIFKNHKIKILAKKDLQKVNPSDIFEFIGETSEIKYLRKN